MNFRTAGTCVGIVALLMMGCTASTRYTVLSFFFDGVPPPAVPTPVVDAATAGQAAAVPQPRVRFSEHGPYGARLCNACHTPSAGNALVLPIEQLCFKCHDLKLDKTYIHGPLASGGCKVCHDPHSSAYRYLLVSESDSFCLTCHSPELIARNPAHREVTEQCMTCHDAHMSNKKYLLR